MSINTKISAEFFNEYGFAYLENIISEDLCNNFTNIMLDFKEKNKLAFENISNSDMYKNSYGRGGITEMEDFLQKLTPILTERLNLKVKPSNTYARIYYNRSTLKPHVDRPGLDYTMSITLFSNLKNDWPLVTIDKLGNEVRCNINRRDGLLIHGTEMKHWRDDLTCAEDECVVQMFLHWTRVNVL